MEDWRNKRKLYRLSLHEKQTLYYKGLDKFFNGKEIFRYKKELTFSKFWKELMTQIENVGLKHLAVAPTDLEDMHVLVRKTKPKLIVETGVYHGMSTAVFLNALKENKKGKLISIDTCKQDPDEIGMYIPNYLKDNWDLRKGKSQDKLKEIEIKPDIFFHDSDHSYKNMTREYEWAIKHVKKGGLIMSHDIGTNNSFFDFIEKYNLEYYLLRTGFRNFRLGYAIV